MRHANISSLVSDAVFVTTLDGTITSWSQGAERLYGWTSFEAIGKKEHRSPEARLSGSLRSSASNAVAGGPLGGRGGPSRSPGKANRCALPMDPVSRFGRRSNCAPGQQHRRHKFEIPSSANCSRPSPRRKREPAELQAILDALPTATFIAHDRECHEMTSSRAAHEMLRLAPGANLSKSALVDQSPSFKLLSGGKELGAHELPIQRAATSGQPVLNTELTVAFDDGTSLDVFGHAVPLKDEAWRSPWCGGFLRRHFGVEAGATGASQQRIPFPKTVGVGSDGHRHPRPIWQLS